jgi:apolipoprotein N-acyltransferase
VRLIQPNAPQDQKWDAAHRDVFLTRMITMTGQGPRPDLIVWPETAVPYLLNYVHGDLVLMAEAARGAPLVFGIQRRDEDLSYHNSLVVMGQGGVLRSTYDKRHLVPFGEYIPGGDLLGQFGIHGLATSDGAGFAAGTAPPRINLPGIGDAIPLICYEGIFAEEVGDQGARPRLLLLITNDAWFGAAAGPYQHLAQARLRAIEQGLPMVRVANTGVSAMIDARGRIVASLPLNSDGALDVALPAARAATLYSRVGDWLLFGILTLLTLGCYLGRRRDSD